MGNYMGMVKKLFNFTVEDISAGKYTSWDLINPMWHEVSIYEGLDVYNRDLKPFSLGQRRIFAIMWYDAEVVNGGHDQFFSNSTGIVWKDALDGLKMVGADKLAENLQKAVDLFGGEVPFDRIERCEILDKITSNPDYDENDEGSEKWLDVFSDMDSVYYSEIYYDELELIEVYVKNHPEEFVLNGEFEVYES